MIRSRVEAPPRSWIALPVALALGFLPGCGAEGSKGVEDRPSSRSYRGHEDHSDADNLVRAYPAIVGTRLDDCGTCHTGTVEEGNLVASSCDHCHDLLLHGNGHAARETLNAFGLDYLAAGRDAEALRRIEEKDSDGDGFSNREELLASRHPGSARSMPGQAVAILRTVTLDELKAIRPHTQFMLSNTSRQRFDDYAVYTGAAVGDLLDAQGISRDGATGITVIAADGYKKSLPIEYVDRVFPRPVFFSGLDERALGPDCGIVRYPPSLPDGVSDGLPIPGEPRLLLAYERNGSPLDASFLDVRKGRIVGEGPLRLVVPQDNPGRPDRGSRFSPSNCGDGSDFDEDADHNAGAMVRGVVALRIDPMPADVEEFDSVNGGWALLESGRLVLYGHNVR